MRGPRPGRLVRLGEMRSPTSSSHGGKWGPLGAKGKSRRVTAVSSAEPGEPPARPALKAPGCWQSHPKQRQELKSTPLESLSKGLAQKPWLEPLPQVQFVQ